MLNNFLTRQRQLIDEINSCLSSLNLNNLTDSEDKYKHIDLAYNKINQESVLTRYSKKNLLQLISKQSGDFENRHYLNEISKAKLSSFRAMDELISARFLLLKDKYAIEKGNYYYHRNRIGEALDVWEKILEQNPDNKHIQSKLSDVANSNDSARKTVEKLRRKYCFKYIESFGFNIGHILFDIVVSDKSGNLFVSDYIKNQVYIFDQQNHFMGNVESDLNYPTGLFKGQNGNIWICDRDNYRIIEVDSSGTVKSKIQLDKILQDKLSNYKPDMGCFYNNYFYLVMYKKNSKRKLIKFSTEYLEKDLVIYQDSKIDVLMDVDYAAEALFVGDFKKSKLYRLQKDNFCRIKSDSIKGFLRRVLSVDKKLFVSTGEYIYKFSLDGKLEFCTAINNKTPFLNSSIFGLASVIKKGKNYLIASDCYNNCLHKFQI